MDLLTSNDQPGQHCDSWYYATANPIPDYPILDASVTRAALECDVCVIGGGFTGLSTALHLAEKGVKVVLLEANRVGWGASGRNGGQVGSGQRCDQITLEKHAGHETAHALWKIALDAGERVRNLIDTHNIQCDYQSGVLDATLTPAEQQEEESYAEHLRKHYGHHSQEIFSRKELTGVLASTAYQGGVLDHSAGHCHPLNLALGIAEAAVKAGTTIFEKTKVVDVQKLNVTAGSSHRFSIHAHPVTNTDTAQTAQTVDVNSNDQTIQAEHVVFACNGYLGNLNRTTAKHVMPINNYIVATEPLGEDAARELIANNMAVADSRFVVNYFRLSADHRLLFGGGESWGYKFPTDIRALVRPKMLSIFPQLENSTLQYAWGGTLAITRSRMPRFSEIEKNMWSASGYSGHGVAMATMAGELLSNAITGDRERFDVMAQLPTRAFPGGDAIRQPLLAAAMGWYAMRDKITALKG